MEFEFITEVERGKYRVKKNSTRLMAADYGHIKGTRGNDGEPVDFYRGVYPDSNLIFVINQFKNGRFDEHKVMIHFQDKNEALEAYVLSTPNNKLRTIVEVSEEQLVWWLENQRKDFPLTEDKLLSIGTAMSNWNENNSKEAAFALYELKKNDATKELEEALNVESVEQEFESLDFEKILEGAQESILDEVVFSSDRLIAEGQKIREAIELQIIDKMFEIFVSDTFKKDGEFKKAIVFEMKDHQTVTVILASKGSVFVTESWFLNRKDVTSFIGSKETTDVATIAKRIALLAQKNAGAFAKANEKLAERDAALEAKEKQIEVMVNSLESLKKERDELVKLVELKRQSPVKENGDEDVAIATQPEQDVPDVQDTVETQEAAKPEEVTEEETTETEATEEPEVTDEAETSEDTEKTKSEDEPEAESEKEVADEAEPNEDSKETDETEESDKEEVDNEQEEYDVLDDAQTIPGTIEEKKELLEQLKEEIAEDEKAEKKQEENRKEVGAEFTEEAIERKEEREEAEKEKEKEEKEEEKNKQARVAEDTIEDSVNPKVEEARVFANELLAGVYPDVSGLAEKVEILMWLDGVDAALLNAAFNKYAELVGDE